MTDHSKHTVISTETGRINLVAGEVSDTRRDVLYCIDCCEEVPAPEQPAVAVNLDSIPF